MCHHWTVKVHGASLRSKRNGCHGEGYWGGTTEEYLTDQPFQSTLCCFSFEQGSVMAAGNENTLSKLKQLS